MTNVKSGDHVYLMSELIILPKSPMPPRSNANRNSRDNDEKPRRALGYNGRRLNGGRGGSRDNNGNRTGGNNNRSVGNTRGSHGGRGGRGGQGRRDGENNNRRVNNSQPRRSVEGNNNRPRFGRRGNNQRNGQDNNNNQGQGQRRSATTDPATLQLLRSLQERIRVLEAERPLINGRGAFRRFGRQVDRAVGDAPRRSERPPIRQRRDGGRGQQRARSPEDRRSSRRGGGRRAEFFDEGRRGGVRDRYDWDEGLESREKRRRHDNQGPRYGQRDVNSLPPLRVRVQK